MILKPERLSGQRIDSDNPRIGAEFQRVVKEWFEKIYNSEFELEKKIAIGNPPKDHKFDIVCEPKKMVIECKRYTWTKAGNVPSANMGFVNEAASYLSFLPKDYDKYIVMLYSYHDKRKQSLAEYYYQTYRHLIGDTHVLEYDPEKDTMREVTCGANIGICY